MLLLLPIIIRVRFIIWWDVRLVRQIIRPVWPTVTTHDASTQCINVLLGRPTLVGRLKLYCCTFLPMHFSQKWRNDGHQIYTRGSVIAKALNRNPEISPTPPLIFTGGGVKKCEFWPHCQRRSTLRTRRLKTEQDISQLWNKLGEQRWRTYVHTKFGEVRPRTPEILSWKRDPLKNFRAIMC